MRLKKIRSSVSRDSGASDGSTKSNASIESTLNSVGQISNKYSKRDVSNSCNASRASIPSSAGNPRSAICKSRAIGANIGK